MPAEPHPLEAHIGQALKHEEQCERGDRQRRAATLRGKRSPVDREADHADRCLHREINERFPDDAEPDIGAAEPQWLAARHEVGERMTQIHRDHRCCGGGRSLPRPHRDPGGEGGDQDERERMRVQVRRPPRRERAHEKLHPVAALRRGDKRPQRHVVPYAANGHRDGHVSRVHLTPLPQPRVEQRHTDARDEECRDVSERDHFGLSARAMNSVR
jgi:hypothetical protein